MTIPKLSISSTDISSETKFLLADGKVVTLKTFCIEEQEPRLSIKALCIGDSFKTRNGQIFKVELTSDTPGGDKLGRGDAYLLWFYDDGRCTNGRNDLDVVEVFPVTVLDRVDQQLAKLEEDDIQRIVISQKEFDAIYGNENVARYHNGVRVKFNSKLGRGEFSIVFKPSQA